MTLWNPPTRGHFGTVTLDISPELAASLLKRNTASNRTLAESRVKRLMRDIAENRWRVTGDSIKFGTDGVLLDGQHRLTAIARGTTNVRTTIAYNVDPAAIRAIDVGNPRHAHDLLKMSGAPNPREVSAAARLILSFDDELRPGPFTASRTEIAEFCMGNERLTASAEWWTMNRTTLMRAGFMMGPTVAFVYLVGDALAADACDFLMFVATGAGLELNTAAHSLQRWLLQRGSGHAFHDSDRHMFVACLIKAYNAHRMGTPTKLIVWRRTEPFPKVLTPVYSVA